VYKPLEAKQTLEDSSRVKEPLEDSEVLQMNQEINNFQVNIPHQHKLGLVKVQVKALVRVLLKALARIQVKALEINKQDLVNHRIHLLKVCQSRCLLQVLGRINNHSLNKMLQEKSQDESFQGLSTSIQ